MLSARKTLSSRKSVKKHKSGWILVRQALGVIFCVLLYFSVSLRLDMKDKPPTVTKENEIHTAPIVSQNVTHKPLPPHKPEPKRQQQQQLQQILNTGKTADYVLPDKLNWTLVPLERRKTPEIRHHLRFNWANLTVTSPITTRLDAHQTNCSLPLGNYGGRKKVFGLGSKLHVWGQALCNAMEQGVRIRSLGKQEIWNDEQACTGTNNNASTMLCYFPYTELQCPQDYNALHKIKHEIDNPIKVKCDDIMKDYNLADFRAAAAEMLFSHVSPVVVQEAERQLNLVFPDSVPKGLITCHVRWGDKKYESKLLEMKDYMRGIRELLQARGDEIDGPAHIFLATEDPNAIAAFQEQAPSNWKLYIDQFYYDLIPYRPQHGDIPYNIVPKISRALKGKVGLWTLGSLLVAMEADAFVLATASNWSRLMNELRKNVLDPRCGGNCTLMVDLKYGEW